MKTRLFRPFSVLVLVIIGLLLIVSPVLAIDTPDALSINSVYVYHHCLETNDQLYIVEYTITYTPANPDENVTEAYLGRLMNGAAELKAVAPYAYFDDGYGTGIFALYFPALDPNLPVWAGAYTMRLEGNPTLAWVPDIPNTSAAAFDLWSASTSITATQDELTARILGLADQLELDWGINMLDNTATGSYLSSYGEAYFTSVIPNIRNMTPRAFAGGTTSPDWSTKTPTTTYADDRAHSPDGTLLDVQLIADWWGISRTWTSTVLFMLGSAFLLFAMLKPTGSFRGLTFLSIPLFIAGGYLGMIPLVLTVLIGFAAFALSIFFLFYHPSGV